MFGRDKEPYAPQDVLCVFSEDGTAAIAPIVDINDERILAESESGNYSVPAADIRAYTGPRGRIFLYPSTTENVVDCQRIAMLERSTVLRQITHFAPEVQQLDGPRINKFVIMGIIAAVVVLIMLVMR